jgi:YfiR/HmsC-like
MKVARPLYVILMTVVCCIVPITTTHAEPLTAEVAELRAAFVYNLLRFSTWRHDVEKQADASAPLTLCHVGTELTDRNALQALDSKSIKGHRITVRSVVTRSQLEGCQALLVGEHAAAPVIDELPRAGVLAIGPATLLQHGGGVGLVIADNKMNMTFNLENLKRSEIDLSAQVLTLGRVMR